MIKKQIRYFLMFIVSIFFSFAFTLPALATEKECRELNKEVLRLSSKFEELQAEAARPSSMVDRAKQRELAKKNVAVARAVENLTPKAEKANCKQYSWWAEKSGAQSESTNQKNTWCAFDMRTDDEPQKHTDPGQDIPHCDCTITGAEVLRVKTDITAQLARFAPNTPFNVEEIKDSAGKVIKVEINNNLQNSTMIYFRDHVACKKMEAPFIVRQKELENPKIKKDPAYE